MNAPTIWRAPAAMEQLVVGDRIVLAAHYGSELLHLARSVGMESDRATWQPEEEELEVAQAAVYLGTLARLQAVAKPQLWDRAPTAESLKWSLSAFYRPFGGFGGQGAYAHCSSIMAAAHGLGIALQGDRVAVEPPLPPCTACQRFPRRRGYPTCASCA